MGSSPVDFEGMQTGESRIIYLLELILIQLQLANGQGKIHLKFEDKFTWKDSITFHV